jgi:hypothetical protein
MLVSALAPLLLLAPNQASERSEAAALDIRCFSLMADLARDGGPEVRGAATIAAHYFLGRVDAIRPGYDPDAAAPDLPAGDAGRAQLIAACGEVLAAEGRDLRTIGEMLAPPAQPTA